MDKYRIDSHKLIYHVERVSAWLKGDATYPVYAEMAPAGSCNHRCTYCALDFMEYQPRFLETGILMDRISEMAALGFKSIMYAGEGEPLLHKDINKIVNHTKKSGIDVALTTNGALLNQEIADSILSSVSWIKVSINGANKDTYAKIHRCQPEDFKKVIKNLSYAARLRKAKGYKCALGMQILLLPENSRDLLPLAKIARGIGMDYLVVKPYSHHPLSRTQKYKNIRYDKYLSMAQKLEKLNSADFSVIFRLNTMKKWDRGVHSYRHCYALGFWSYIDAGGDVWGCSAYLGDKRFLYGNIYKNSFKQIWNGDRKRKAIRMATESLDTDKCRVNCRMDEINKYLWELKNPPEHVNFI